MFKKVQDLISIKISEKKCKILSMKSKLENCKNFISFIIISFNGDQLESMYKLIYNTGLNSFHLDVNFISNIKGMVIYICFYSYN